MMKWCFVFLLGLFSTCIYARGNGKPVTEYIIHVVKFGETLSKISREYGVTITDILNVNPSLADENNLSPEEIIRIPNKTNKKVLNDSKSTNKELIPKVVNKQEFSPGNPGKHTVVKGETLYSISKLYNLKVADLQKWNGLTDFSVKIGSELIVSDPSGQPVKKIVIDTKPALEKQVMPVKKEAPVLQDTDTLVDSSADEKPDIQASDNASQKELGKIFKDIAGLGNIQSVKGTGAPMTTTLGAMEKVYFAMHKTLPIGTVIKIKNLVNSKVVYAKVIGKLPDTDENKHVIVRYSLGVKKDLQLQNGKCYVQIEF